MRTMPLECRKVNTVSGFCTCISSAEPVDAAARAFCLRAGSGDTKTTGDDLVELKKALMDLEDEECL